MKRILVILSLLVFLIADIKSYAVEPEASELYAKAAVLMDADSGRVLYEKNGFELMPMASTTKIMTLIVALEMGNPDDVVTVSKYASTMPDVQLNIREGETYYLNDLLYSLMLESHNDSAVAIAEHIAGSIEEFAKLMNQKALEIGCMDSYFITPNGLDATAKAVDAEGKEREITHSITARDLARIMSYCIKQSPKREEFLQITGTSNYSFSDLEQKRHFTCNNHNAFLTMMDGALSGKTGFTSKAGYCYVGALQRDNRTFVVALLACGWPGNKTYKWKDTRKLMTYGIDNYEFCDFNTIEIDSDKLKVIPVLNAQTEFIGATEFINPVLEDQNKQLSGVLIKKDEKLDVIYKIKKELTAPVKKKEVLGNIILKIEDEELKEYLVYSDKQVNEIDYSWCALMIWKAFSL